MVQRQVGWHLVMVEHFVLEGGPPFYGSSLIFKYPQYLWTYIMPIFIQSGQHVCAMQCVSLTWSCGARKLSVIDKARQTLGQGVWVIKVAGSLSMWCDPPPTTEEAIMHRAPRTNRGPHKSQFLRRVNTSFSEPVNGEVITTRSLSPT